MVSLATIRLGGVAQGVGVKPTYYVSSSQGNDANDGRTEATAIASLDVVNALELVPGDFVAFKAGDSWDGTLNVNYSGNGKYIKYGRYGVGDNPKIYGSKKITTFSLTAGFVYEKTLDSAISQVFVDGKRLPISRLDNNGDYYSITSVNSQTEFITNVPSEVDDYYAGASLVIRTSSWDWEIVKVVGSVGSTLTTANSIYNTIASGHKFFLVNNVNFLTEESWTFDSATNKLSIWLEYGDSPVFHEVRISNDEVVVSANSKDYIQFDGFQLLHGRTAVSSYSGNNFLINNVECVDNEYYGLYISGTNTKNLVRNFKATGQNSRGIEISNSLGVIITDFEINDIGLLENIGLNGIMWRNSYAILCNSSNYQSIRYGKIKNIGYSGIRWTGLGASIQYNYLDNTSLNLVDGGAIYTWAASLGNPNVAGSVIRYNIITNNMGSSAIYMDDRTQDVLIEYNTVIGPNESLPGLWRNKGMFFHNVKNVTCRFNTFYNCTRLLYSTDTGTGTYTGNNFYSNVCINKSATPLGDGYLSPNLVYLSISGNELVLNDNTYVDRSRPAPFSDPINNIGLTLEEWQSATGQDSNSTFDNAALNVDESQVIIYNSTKKAKTFYLNGASGVKNDATGEEVNENIVLLPYTSMPLRGVGVEFISDVLSA